MKIYNKKSVEGISKFLFYIEVSLNIHYLPPTDNNVPALQWLQHAPEDPLLRLRREPHHPRPEPHHRPPLLGLLQRHRPSRETHGFGVACSVLCGLVH